MCRNESSPNELKLFNDFFNKRDPRSFVEGPEGEGVRHKTPGNARGPGHVPMGCAHLEANLRVKPMPINPINRETIKNNPRSEVPPLQAFVATKNKSGAHFGTLSEGEIIARGHVHHPYGLHDKGVVHPRS